MASGTVRLNSVVKVELLLVDLCDFLLLARGHAPAALLCVERNGLRQALHGASGGGLAVAIGGINVAGSSLMLRAAQQIEVCGLHERVAGLGACIESATAHGASEPGRSMRYKCTVCLCIAQKGRYGCGSHAPFLSIL